MEVISIVWAVLLNINWKSPSLFQRWLRAESRTAQSGVTASTPIAIKKTVFRVQAVTATDGATVNPGIVVATS